MRDTFFKLVLLVFVCCICVGFYFFNFKNKLYQELDKSSKIRLELQEKTHIHVKNRSDYGSHQDFFQPIVVNTSYVFSAFLDNRRGGRYIEVKVFYFLKAVGSADTRGLPRFCVLYYPDGNILTMDGKTFDWFQMSKPR